MNNKTELLKQVKEKYPKGTVFKSTTGNIIIPHSGEVKWAENWECIVSTSGGVLYEDGVFAEIVGQVKF